MSVLTTSFVAYLTNFGKTYTGDGYVMRQNLFEKKLAQVNAHNEEYRAGKRTWFAGLNMYSDWSAEELSGIKGMFTTDRHDHTRVMSKPVKNPTRMDWREHGVVTPVKRQGCGDCWAFASAEVLESYQAIATGELVVLSPQAFVDCLKNPNECGGTGGCEGATGELAFNFTAHMGIPLASDYPSTGRDGTCIPYKAAVGCTGYTDLPVNDASALETAVANIGPIVVAVAANWDIYAGGILSDACKIGESCTLDHAVVVVGYDQDYWLVRNSWGESWGESGYVRLARKNDNQTFVDHQPKSGVACKPYPKVQIVGGESGLLFDMTFPTGVGSSNGVLV